MTASPGDHLPDDPFQAEFEEWTVVEIEEPVRDMDAEIRVHPDQMGIEAA